MKLNKCICGNTPVELTKGVQDHGATLPIPYYECKGCAIGAWNYGDFPYPGQVDKAANNWNKFIENLKSRLYTGV